MEQNPEKIEPDGISTPLIQEFKREEWPSRGFESEITERPPITPEIKEKMDKELMGMGNLMKDSSVWWQLDGALNISLQKGEYMGVHVDLDISVLRNQIPQLEEYLAQRGYGLFLRKTDKTSGNRIFKRVGADAFKQDENHEWQLRIGAMDKTGNIDLNADPVSADVAVIEKDERGQLIGWRNTVLPEKWLGGKIMDFHGVPINLSHPGRLLFNKIWFTRGYDERDLEQLAETKIISLEDIDDVERLADPILRDFEKDENIGKEHADLIRERFVHLREIINKEDQNV